MRWTLYWLTKPVHRLLFPDRAANPRSFMKSAIFWQSSWSVEKPVGKWQRWPLLWVRRLSRPETYCQWKGQDCKPHRKRVWKRLKKFFNQLKTWTDPENLEIQHNVILALRAHNLMFRDQDYVVRMTRFSLSMSLPDVLCGKTLFRRSAPGHWGERACEGKARE